MNPQLPPQYLFGDISWTELHPELSVNDVGILNYHGITTPGDLVRVTPDELLFIKSQLQCSEVVKYRIADTCQKSQTFGAPSPLSSLLSVFLIVKFQMASWRNVAGRVSSAIQGLGFSDGFIHALAKADNVSVSLDVLRSKLINRPNFESEYQFIQSFCGVYLSQKLAEMGVRSLMDIVPFNKSHAGQLKAVNCSAGSINKLLILSEAVRAWSAAGMHHSISLLISRGYFKPEDLPDVPQHMIFDFFSSFDKIERAKFSEIMKSRAATPPPESSRSFWPPQSSTARYSLLRPETFPPLADYGVYEPQHLLDLNTQEQPQIRQYLYTLGFTQEQLNREYQVISAWSNLPFQLKHLIPHFIRLNISLETLGAFLENVPVDFPIKDGEIIQLKMMSNLPIDEKLLISYAVPFETSASDVLRKCGIQKLNLSAPPLNGDFTNLASMEQYSKKIIPRDGLSRSEAERLVFILNSIKYWDSQNLLGSSAELLYRGYFNIEPLRRLKKTTIGKLFPHLNNVFGNPLSDFGQDSDALEPTWFEFTPFLDPEKIGFLSRKGFGSPFILSICSPYELERLCSELSLSPQDKKRLMFQAQGFNPWREQPLQLKRISHIFVHMGFGPSSSERKVIESKMLRHPVADGYLVQVRSVMKVPFDSATLKSRIPPISPSIDSAFELAGLQGMSSDLKTYGLNSVERMDIVHLYISSFSVILTYEASRNVLSNVSKMIADWKEIGIEPEKSIHLVYRGYYSVEDLRQLSKQEVQALFVDNPQVLRWAHENMQVTSKVEIEPTHDVGGLQSQYEQISQQMSEANIIGQVVSYPPVDSGSVGEDANQSGTFQQITANANEAPSIPPNITTPQDEFGNDGNQAASSPVGSQNPITENAPGIPIVDYDNQNEYEKLSYETTEGSFTAHDVLHPLVDSVSVNELADHSGNIGHISVHPDENPPNSPYIPLPQNEFGNDSDQVASSPVGSQNPITENAPGIPIVDYDNQNEYEKLSNETPEGSFTAHDVLHPLVDSVSVNELVEHSGDTGHISVHPDENPPNSPYIPLPQNEFGNDSDQVASPPVGSQDPITENAPGSPVGDLHENQTDLPTKTNEMSRNIPSTIEIEMESKGYGTDIHNAPSEQFQGDDDTTRSKPNEQPFMVGFNLEEKYGLREDPIFIFLAFEEKYVGISQARFSIGLIVIGDENEKIHDLFKVDTGLYYIIFPNARSFKYRFSVFWDGENRQVQSPFHYMHHPRNSRFIFHSEVSFKKTAQYHHETGYQHNQSITFGEITREKSIILFKKAVKEISMGNWSQIPMKLIANKPKFIQKLNEEVENYESSSIQKIQLGYESSSSNNIIVFIAAKEPENEFFVNNYIFVSISSVRNKNKQLHKKNIQLNRSTVSGVYYFLLERLYNSTYYFEIARTNIKSKLFQYNHEHPDKKSCIFHPDLEWHIPKTFWNFFGLLSNSITLTEDRAFELIYNTIITWYLSTESEKNPFYFQRCDNAQYVSESINELTISCKKTHEDLYIISESFKVSKSKNDFSRLAFLYVFLANKFQGMTRSNQFIEKLGIIVEKGESLILVEIPKHIKKGNFRIFMTTLREIAEQGMKNGTSKWPYIAWFLNFCFETCASSLHNEEVLVSNFIISRDSCQLFQVFDQEYSRNFIQLLKLQSLLSPIHIPDFLVEALSPDGISKIYSAMKANEKEYRPGTIKEFWSSIARLNSSQNKRRVLQVVQMLFKENIREDATLLLLEYEPDEAEMQEYVSAFKQKGVADVFSDESSIKKLLMKKCFRDPKNMIFIVCLICENSRSTIAVENVIKNFQGRIEQSTPTEKARIVVELTIETKRLELMEHMNAARDVYGMLIRVAKKMDAENLVETLSLAERDILEENVLESIKDFASGLCKEIPNRNRLCSKIIQNPRTTKLSLSVAGVVIKSIPVPDDPIEFFTHAAKWKERVEFLGKYSDSYSEFRSFAKQIYAVSNTIKDDIMSGNYSIKIASHLYKRRNQVIDFYESNSNVSKAFSSFCEALEALKYTREVFMSSLFTEFMQIPYLSNCNEQLILLLDNQQNKMEAVTIFSEAKVLRENSKILCQLSKSKIFRSIWEIQIRKITTELSETADARPSNLSIESEEHLIKHLIRPCLSEFEKFLELMDNGDISVVFLFLVMKLGIETGKELAEDIRILSDNATGEKKKHIREDNIAQAFECVSMIKGAAAFLEGLENIMRILNISPDIKEGATFRQLEQLNELYKQMEHVLYPSLNAENSQEKLCDVVQITSPLQQMFMEFSNISFFFKNISDKFLGFLIEIHEKHQGRLAELFELCFAKVDDQKNVSLLKKLRQVVERLTPIVYLKSAKTFDEFFSAISEIKVDKRMVSDVQALNERLEEITFIISDAQSNPVARAVTIMRKLVKDYVFIFENPDKGKSDKNVLFAYPRDMHDYQEKLKESQELSTYGTLSPQKAEIQKESSRPKIYKEEDIDQLRSRLRMARSTEENKAEIDSINAFMQVLDAMFDIKPIFVHLCELSHPKYYTTKEIVECKSTLEYVATFKKQFTDDLNGWRALINEVRESNPVVNYFRTHQLIQMRNIGFPYESAQKVLRAQMEGYGIVEVLSMYIPDITPEHFAEWYTEIEEKIDMSRKGALEDDIRNIATALGLLSSLKIKLNKEKNINHKSIMRGKPNVIRVQESSRALHNVMSLYIEVAKRLPNPWELLLCIYETRIEDVELFLRRCLQDKESNEDMFCVACSENLKHYLQVEFCEIYERLFSKFKNRSFRLVIFFPSEHDNAIRSHFRGDLKEETFDMRNRLKGKINELLEKRKLQIHVLKSPSAGEGKTFNIKKMRIKQSVRDTKSIQLSHTGTLVDLTKKLSESMEGQHNNIHINLGPTLEFTSNIHLFMILFMRKIILSDNTFFSLPSDCVIFFELPSTPDATQLEKTLSIFDLFEVSPLQTELDVSLENPDLVRNRLGKRFNMIQYVCKYLRAMNIAPGAGSIKFKVNLDTPDLSSAECQTLLERFFPDKTRSERINFVKIMFDQLEFFDQTVFLDPNFNDFAQILRPKISQWIVESAKDICTSCFSNEPVKKAGQSSISTVFEVQKRWKSSSLPIALFNDDSGDGSGSSISILQFSREFHFDAEIRRVRLEPEKIYDYKNQEQFHEIIRRIFGLEPNELKRVAEAAKGGVGLSDYVFTSDNLAKIMSIYSRIKSGLPVLIVGETGCGKTRMVEFISRIVGKGFGSLRVHGGTKKGDIERELRPVIEMAVVNPNNRYFFFLDEINTSTLLGIFKEMMCDHTMEGEELPKNLTFIAACNPYRKKETRGQSSKTKVGIESHVQSLQSRTAFDDLVYAVYPLPLSLAQYAWDFGSVYGNDEAEYIEFMVNSQHIQEVDLNGKYVQALVKSQAYIRNHCREESFVSLRDIERSLRLLNHFQNFHITAESSKQSCVTRSNSFTYEHKSSEVINAAVLSLVCNYLFRLNSDELRVEYHREICLCFQKPASFSKEVLHQNAKFLLDNLDLPAGTARNTALLENIFMMVHSLSNKIPLIIVGDPGCSKSFGLHILKKNLVPENKRNYKHLSALKSMIFLTHQCSPESTSEGIIEVHERASGQKKEDASVIPIVVLDEIGLAEQSPKNPLKVLHWLFEDKEVGFLGLSNWSLDAAKMNRAILVTRPKPTVEELVSTAKGLIGVQKLSDMGHIPRIAQGFASVYKGQYEKIGKHFFGLRDFYFIMKSIYKGEMINVKTIKRCISRNINGLDRAKMDWIQDSFKEIDGGKIYDIPTLDLIRENLEDNSGRHLMLITSNDCSALQNLYQCGILDFKDSTIFFSSDFVDERKEYNIYNSILKVRNCMERGDRLILVNQTQIYESLYDLFNLHYFTVGYVSYCYLPIGPQADEPFEVHPSFKCIVITTAQDALSNPPKGLPPPFLNRFEKQALNSCIVIDSMGLHDLRDSLRERIRELAQKCGAEKDSLSIFPGVTEDSIDSVVIVEFSKAKENGKENNTEEIVQSCLEALINIAATPDMVMCKGTDEKKVYFEVQEHDSLVKYYERRQKMQGKPDSKMGHLVQVTTNTRILTRQQLRNSLVPLIRQEQISCVDLHLLGSSERFEENVYNFLQSADGAIMFINCDMGNVSNMRINHCKFICSKLMADWIEDNRKIEKNIIMICYLSAQSSKRESLTIGFDPMWENVFLDSLLSSKFTLSSTISSSLDEIVKSILDGDIDTLIQHEYVNALSRLEYPDGFDFREKIKVSLQILGETQVSKAFGSKLHYLMTKEKKGGANTGLSTLSLEVAKDKNMLSSYGSFRDSMVARLEKHIYVYVQKLIFIVDRFENMRHLDSNKAQNLDIRAQFLQVMNSLDFWNASGEIYEGYSILVTHPQFQTGFPFSYLVFSFMETLKILEFSSKSTKDILKSSKRIQNQLQATLRLDGIDREMELYYVRDFLFYQKLTVGRKSEVHQNVSIKIIELISSCFECDVSFGDVHFIYWAFELWLRKLILSLSQLSERVLTLIRDRLNGLRQVTFSDVLNLLYEIIYSGYIESPENRDRWLHESENAIQSLQAISLGIDSLQTYPTQREGAKTDSLRVGLINAKLLFSLTQLGTALGTTEPSGLVGAGQEIKRTFTKQEDYEDIEKLQNLIDIIRSIALKGDEAKKKEFRSESIQIVFFDLLFSQGQILKPDVLNSLFEFLLGRKGNFMNLIGENLSNTSFVFSCLSSIFKLLDQRIVAYANDINTFFAEFQETNSSQFLDLEPMVLYAHAYERVMYENVTNWSVMEDPETIDGAEFVSELHQIAYLKARIQVFTSQLVQSFQGGNCIDSISVEKVCNLMERFPDLANNAISYLIKCVEMEVGAMVAYDYLTKESLGTLRTMFLQFIGIEKTENQANLNILPLHVKSAAATVEVISNLSKLIIEFGKGSTQSRGEIAKIKSERNITDVPFPLIFAGTLFETKQNITQGILAPVMSIFKEEIQLNPVEERIVLNLLCCPQILSYYQLLQSPDRIGLDTNFKISFVIQCLLFSLTKSEAEWPLRVIFSRPKESQNMWIPTMPDDPRKLPIVKIIESGMGAYLCPNGHLYTIPPCTWPWDEGICSFCPEKIEGTRHIFDRGNVRIFIDDNGAVKPDPQNGPHRYVKDVNENAPKGYEPVANHDAMTERNMPQRHFRTLRILVHASYLLSSISENADFSKLPQQPAHNLFWRNYTDDWEFLKASLNLNDQQLFYALIGLLDDLSAPQLPAGSLSTVEGRDEWEEEIISAVINNWISKIATIVEKKMKEAEKGENLRIFENKIAESYDKTNENSRAIYKPCLFNPMAKVTKRLVITSFVSGESSQRNYPLIHAIFAHLEKIKPLKQLHSLVSFYLMIHEKMSVKYSLSDIKEFSIKSVIEKLASEDKEPDAFRQQWGHVSKELIECWNSSFEYVNQKPNRPGQRLTQINEDSKLTAILPTMSRDTQGLIEIIEILSDAHNEIIEAGWRQKLNRDDYTPIQLISKETVVEWDMDDSKSVAWSIIDRCTSLNYEPKEGRDVKLNWEKMEGLIFQKVVSPRNLIMVHKLNTIPGNEENLAGGENQQQQKEKETNMNFSLPIFKYSDDIASFTPWFKLQKKVKQQEMTKEKFERILTESSVRSGADCYVVYKETLLYANYIALTGGSPQMKISEYVDEVLRRKKYHEAFALVSLCELKDFSDKLLMKVPVEDLMPSIYKKKLDSGKSSIVRDYLRPLKGSRLKELSDGLYEFIKEYLMETSYSETASLQRYLVSIIDPLPNEENFPNIELCYTHAFWQEVKRNLETDDD